MFYFFQNADMAPMASLKQQQTSWKGIISEASLILMFCLVFMFLHMSSSAAGIQMFNLNNYTNAFMVSMCDFAAESMLGEYKSRAEPGQLPLPSFIQVRHGYNNIKLETWEAWFFIN